MSSCKAHDANNAEEHRRRCIADLGSRVKNRFQAQTSGVSALSPLPALPRGERFRALPRRKPCSQDLVGKLGLSALRVMMAPKSSARCEFAMEKLCTTSLGTMAEIGCGPASQSTCPYLKFCSLPFRKGGSSPCTLQEKPRCTVSLFNYVQYHLSDLGISEKRQACVVDPR